METWRQQVCGPADLLGWDVVRHLVAFVTIDRVDRFHPRPERLLDPLLDLPAPSLPTSSTSSYIRGNGRRVAVSRTILMLLRSTMSAGCTVRARNMLSPSAKCNSCGVQASLPSCSHAFRQYWSSSPTDWQYSWSTAQIAAMRAPAIVRGRSNSSTTLFGTWTNLRALTGLLRTA